MYEFQKAVPVWGTQLKNPYNQFLGFGAEVCVDDGSRVKLAIAARTYYRVYVNGEMKASGPARTAKGYCRVDEIFFEASGKLRIAVEAAALSKTEKINYDHTMEPGVLAAEISLLRENGAWEAVSATGDGSWRYRELDYRVPMTELMSHCRGIVEYYRLKPDSFRWRTEDTAEFRLPEPVKEQIEFLERRAPYPAYEAVPFSRLEKVRSLQPAEEMTGGRILYISRLVNARWNALVEEKDRFLAQLHRERELPFDGSYERGTMTEGRKSVCLKGHTGPAAFVFSMPRSEVGFLKLSVEAEEETVVDIVHSDHLDRTGTLRGNTYAARYELQKGIYDLVGFDPKLAKYVKVILRTKGQVTFSWPELITYSYPDEERCVFACSDGELNRIYQGARRTLRLNTLDIFMDCPERERGGWLCDSWFTARAAWQLFGDLRVEKDFLENFMLTDAGEFRDGFFPEVYPSRHADGEAGIRSWSFWLLAELWDYYQRSGDRAFIDACRDRVAALLDTLPKYVGESGLFENMEPLFVDWSLSNQSFALYPVSVPVNCLIAYVYEQMGNLYEVERWKEIGAKTRERLSSFQAQWSRESDGYTFRDGAFLSNGCQTEAGIALTLFSGFGITDERYVSAFVDRMGTCPKYRPDPNIGRANLFIGLMVRFVVLARLGRTETLVRELKDVYLPQLNRGAGTLFESIDAFSGCHGFNGMAGALIVNQVLGLGQPEQLTKTVVIAPHPGELDWAYGSALCEDGEITLDWKADQEKHVLDMQLVLPEGWNYVLRLPFALSGWRVRLNGEELEG